MVNLMWAAVGKWLVSDGLGAALNAVNRNVDTELEKERIKGDIIKEHYRHKGEWMRAGGFWLMLLFSLPLALWYGSVVVYSIFWCAGCAYPKDWTIAALPDPLNDWAGVIIISIFGVIGLSRVRR